MKYSVNELEAEIKRVDPEAKPSISTGDLAEPTIEVWQNEKKVNYYLDDDETRCILICGPHIFEDMREVIVGDDLSVSEIQQWLNSPDSPLPDVPDRLVQYLREQNGFSLAEVE